MPPIDYVIGWFFGGIPIIKAWASSNRLKVHCLRSGLIFDEPPHIAIKHENGRKLVHAIGRNASSFQGLPNVTIHSPFDSFSPLFREPDLSEAVFKHAIREVFKARSFLSPSMVLFLEERSTPLSAEELEGLEKFAFSCGLVRLYVFLQADQYPSGQQLSHKELTIHAHANLKPSK